MNRPHPIRRKLLANTFQIGVLLLTPAWALAADTPEQAAIRKTMMITWDKPEARLEVGPIVIFEGRSIAGWTQGGRGGRALLVRNAQGQWQVTVCAGDGLKEASTLQTTGMSPAAARGLASSLAKAEASVPKARRALFSTFDGMVRMGGGAPHPGADPVHKPSHP
ncbi:copper uptake system-associated protein [Variovorax sp. efr-133-TYG-130]|uniref:copper uptake system-associated protein n=1 Tax=Variovorax sp. efr-133-TYG-130 TaxID=3040327 RepID=UPI002553DBCE|nr:copper uptake system-associated protein [Variovorax sp. efr-133-TYG-130]